MPEHLARALEFQNNAVQAANLHRILRDKTWSDTDVEAVLRGALDRLEALDGLEGARWYDGSRRSCRKGEAGLF